MQGQTACENAKQSDSGFLGGVIEISSVGLFLLGVVAGFWKCQANSQVRFENAVCS